MATYKVSVNQNPGDADSKAKVRLIRAKLKTTAKAHAADAHISVEPCSEDDLIALTKAGVEIENADAAQAPAVA